MITLIIHWPHLGPLRVCLPGVDAVVVCGPEPQEDAELVTGDRGQLRAGDHGLHNAVGACPGREQTMTSLDLIYDLIFSFKLSRLSCVFVKI